MLVKLLDAGERLPVHVHPDRAWAGRHLGCRYGKTEAWYVVAADEGARCTSGSATTFLGRFWPSASTRGRGVAAGRHARIRRSRRGDGILVPAGQRARDRGGRVRVEAQEPTDFSILLEWPVRPRRPAEGHLGLGFDTALGAVDVRGHAPDEVDALVGPRRLERSDTVLPVLPRAADDYFRMHVARPATAVTVPAASPWS